MLNELGLQRCQSCVLCGSTYGREGQPPSYRRPTQKVQGFGPLPCDVLILGEAPGEHEDLAGRPFVGKAGEFLRQIIQESGLDQLTYYITNTVKCRPPGNRKPTPQERQACSPWLEMELADAQPKYIIALGDSAMSMFFPKGKVKGKVGDWIGQPLPYQFYGSITQDQYIPIGCYHPAARSPSQRATILPVFQQVAGYFGIIPPAREQVDYQVEEVN